MSIRKDAVRPASQAVQDLEADLKSLEDLKPKEISIPSFAFNFIFPSDNTSIIFPTGNGIAIASQKLLEVTRLAKICDVPASALAYSEHASLFYLGDRRGNFHVVNFQTLKVESKVQMFKANIHNLIMNFDETLIYGSVGSGEVVSIDAGTLEGRILYTHDELAVMYLCLSKDGEILLSGCESNFKVYSIMQESVLKVVALDGTIIMCLAVSWENDKVAVGDKDGLVHVWDTASWNEDVYKSNESSIVKIAFGQNVLCSASQDKMLRIWNLNRKMNPIIIETSETLTAISLNETHIYYAYPNLISFMKIPEMPNEYKIQTNQRNINGVIYSSKKKLLITYCSGDKIVKVWNTEKYEELICIKDLENEFPVFFCCLSGDQRHVYASLSNKTIKKWCIDDFTSEVFAISDYLASSLVCTPDNKYLISIDSTSRCIVRNTSDGSAAFTFTHHKMGGISLAVTHLSNILLTLGSDHTIFIYNLITGTNLGKMEGFQSDGAKIKVSIDDRLLALSTLEQGVYIWSIEKKSLLHNLKVPNSKCSEIFFTQDNKTLIVQSYNVDGSDFYFFSLQGFQLITVIHSDQQSLSMSLINDEKFMVIGEGSNIYIRENPLKLETFRVVGPSSKYPIKYFKYLTELNSGQHHNYVEEMNKYVMVPSLMGSLNFFAYKNLGYHLEQALRSGFSPFLTRNCSEVMSISLEKGHVDCTGVILRQIILDLKTNPYAACFIENSLSLLTMQSHIELEEFYRSLMFIPKDSSLPRFADVSNYYFKSPYFEIIPSFMINESNDGKSVKFYQSGVKVSSEVGSSDSINYLECLLKTGNNEIFRSKFVEALLLEKWREIRWFAELYGGLYLFYLIILSLYTLNRKDYFIILMIIQNTILIFYELYQLALTKLDYFKDGLNLTDSARITLFIVYLASGANSGVLLFFLNLFSWFRGISHFRVFTSTRYLVNLLLEVVKDILPFLVLLFYFTLAFTFMNLSLHENNSYSSFTVISDTFLLNFGDFSISSETGSWNWVCFIISSLVNFLIMVNLLISIIGDTYDKVQAYRQIADRREMAQIILEIEYLMIWKRNENHKSFIHILKEDSLNEEEESWQGKVKELQDFIGTIRESVDNQRAEFQVQLARVSSDVSLIKQGLDKLLRAQNLQ